MNCRLLLAAVMALVLLPVSAQAQLTAPAQPQPAIPSPPKLTTVGTYPGSGGRLLVGTFVENNDRVGLIGIAVVRRTSIAFNKDEWGSLLALWQQARAVRSNTWKPVGSFTETGTKEPAELTVMGGPGVQFTIKDAKGTSTVSLERADLAKLDASLRRVERFLTLPEGVAMGPEEPVPAPKHRRRARLKPPPAAVALPGPRCTGFWC